MRLPNFDSEETRDDKGPQQIESILRSTWIAEVRNYHLRTTGKQSNYIPGPRLDGGKDSHGSRFKPVWPKLAKFVLENNLEPIKFIKAQFYNCKGMPPKSPTMLLGQVAIFRYRTYIAYHPQTADLKYAYEIQLRQAKDALEYYRLLYKDDENAYKAMLLDDNLSLSAIFRYIMAKNANMTNVANIYVNAAALQFIESTNEYIEIYKDLIPSELHKVAGDITAIKAVGG